MAISGTHLTLKEEQEGVARVAALVHDLARRIEARLEKREHLHLNFLGQDALQCRHLADRLREHLRE